MAYVADLHIHSRFSRACSKDINPANLAKWAKKKGIDLLGTGDCLHPLWRKEIQSQMFELGNGLYECEGMKFILSCEVSSIYKDKNKLRRVHLVILMPSLSSTEKLAQTLTKRGVNLTSDGRPITGISAHDMTEIILSSEPKAIVLPAHIWTPHFAMFGALSGYQFLEECFGDMSESIYAVETGLSSDPSMNWRVANLDQRSIVSCSDAHSVPNIGREATIFAGGLSFDELKNDLKTQNLVGTIEFFPEEGMYHYSGHRNCDVVFSPAELKQNGLFCPKCKKPLIIGVTVRVEELATRSEEGLKLKTADGIIKSETFPNRPGFRKLVELDKIIAASFGMGRAAQKVQAEYEKLVGVLSSELMILTKTPLGEIASLSNSKIAEGIGRVREGKLEVEPGYDGKYGVINIWPEEDQSNVSNQQGTLF